MYACMCVKKCICVYMLVCVHGRQLPLPVGTANTYALWEQIIAYSFLARHPQMDVQLPWG